MKHALAFTTVVVALVAAPAAAQSRLDREVAAAPDARIEVANVRGTIEIEAWDQPRIAIGGTLGEGSELKVEGEGAAVSIRIETPDGKGWRWWGSGGVVADTRLQLKVPRAAALEVDAVSAQVRIDGIDGSRELGIDSVSGDVRLSAGTARLKVSSVSGDVEIASAAPRAILESVSGDIVARGLSGEIDLETVSGDARIEAGEVDRLDVSTVSGTFEVLATPRGAATIKGETMSGELTLRLPAALSARIEAETFSGGLRSDFGSVDEAEHGPGKRLRTTVGDGAARIELETFSGDLEIVRR